MKAAVLFPGQGSQYAGMGKDLFNNYSNTKLIYEKASEILDWDIQEVCFEDKNAIINQTRYTQAALFTTNYAIYEAFRQEGLKADCTLGFSLGEYDAIAASGALDFKDCLKLVEKRGLFMEECAKVQPGGMAAVIGLETASVLEVCKKISEELGTTLEVANDNCPGQVTIAGTSQALTAAKDALISKGARRVIPLKVSGAFHSPLMEKASQKMKELVSDITFNEVKMPIVSNVTARFMDSQEIKKNIPLQITHGVRFRESILYLLGEGFDTFIEVGPKTTLSNLVKKISKEAVTYHVETTEDLKKIANEAGGKNA